MLMVLVSMPTNLPSRRVMEKLGMTYTESDDFDHPNLVNHRLCRHVLYRMHSSLYKYLDIDIYTNCKSCGRGKRPR